MAEPVRVRCEGVSAIRESMARDEWPSLLLIRDGVLSAEAKALVAAAQVRDVPTLFESEREMRRMPVSGSAEAIALLGPPPRGELNEMLAAPGLIILLVRLGYPRNVGFILRSAEVAGAAGVIVANDWAASEQADASRLSIRADRFLPVRYEKFEAATEVVSQARRAGRQVLAVETSGEDTPWSFGFELPSLLVLGGETTGIPEEILREADRRIRIPTRGFIPSYNVQAATSMLLGEWLRQTSAERLGD